MPETSAAVKESMLPLQKGDRAQSNCRVGLENLPVAAKVTLE